MRKYLIRAFFLLLVVYVLFQARNIILGPRIAILSPEAESTVPVGVMVVSGTAQNISFLALDDRQIYTDTAGRWSEKLIAAPGINIIKLTARDRFGREAERRVRILAK